MTIQQVASGEEAEESQIPPAPRRGRIDVTRIVVGLVALLFFAGPALAGAAGQHPGEIENRKLAPFPSVSDGWEFFPKFNRWAVDHLPLRDRAVDANNEISDAAFNELPATAGRPAVVRGTGDWLFLNEEFEHACAGRDTIAQTGEAMTRLSRIAGTVGVPMTVLVPPDKSSVETDMLPADYPLARCANEAKRALREQLATAPPPGYVDLFGPILEIKRQRGVAYIPQDTHWDDFCRAEYAKALARRLDPNLLRDVTVVPTGSRQAPGDLNLLRGKPGLTSPFAAATLGRTGVTITFGSRTVGAVQVVTSTGQSSAAPLFPGRTVLIGDSFTEASLGQLAPFFADLTVLYPMSQTVPPAVLAEILRSADTLIYEQVERNYVNNTARKSRAPVLNRAYLDELEQLIQRR